MKLSLLAVNRGASDVSVTSVAIAGFDAPAACAPGAVKKDAVYTCAVRRARAERRASRPRPTSTITTGSIRRTRRSRSSIPDVQFGVPFAPTPFRVTFHVKAGDVEVTREVPVEFRYVKDIYLGDKRMELNVVPAFSVSVTPALAVIPAPAYAAPRGGTGQARNPCLGDQWHQGRGAGLGVARSAGGLEGDSRERAAQLRARRRIAFGPLRGHRSGAGENRRVHAARGGHFPGTSRTRSSPTATRKSSIRTSSGAR